MLRKIVWLQIGILILASFSFSYFAGIGMVSAEVKKCCLETNDGAFCQDVLAGDCSSGLLPTSCDKTVDCREVCCFDSSQGLCYPRSPRQFCESRGGVENSDATCSNVVECNKGCCVLGAETEFVTQRRCEVRAEQEGFAVDFRLEFNEAMCLELAEEQEEGACIYEAGSESVCVFTSEAGCVRAGGGFNESILCTNSELGDYCEATQTTNCFEGEGEVYFVDSCGNKANIYDASRVSDDSYWQTVVAKADSCGAGQGNIEDDECGNCDYELGSGCGVGGAKLGGRVCQNLNCPGAAWIVDSMGNILENKDRVNGESWCVYDGAVDNGTDIVGSRHWRYYCHDGDVNVEPCSDFRQEVCGRAVVEGVNADGFAEEAEEIGCFVNRWRECVGVNFESYEETKGYETQEQLFEKLSGNKTKDFRKSCEKIGFCNYEELNLSTTPNIPMCLPRFPGGLEFWEHNNSNKDGASQTTCGVASQIPYIGTCTKVTKCGSCISGCGCGTDKWLEEVNRICASFGDCGAYVNVVEVVTDDGYDSTSGADGTSKGRSLNADYLNSLKEIVNKLPEEDVEVLYKNVSNLTTSELIRSMKKASKKYEGMFGGLGNVWDKVPVIGPIFNWIWEAIGIIKKCEAKRTYYHYTCLPWQAPSGGEDCYKCNDLENGKGCSEYRCKSLGQACEFLNEGSEDELCFWINKDDRDAPVIDVWGDVLPEDASYVGESCNSDLGCYKLEGSEEGGCITPYTDYAIGIKADEAVQCKIDINHTEKFEDMANWLESNSYLLEHADNISFLSPGHIYEALGVEIENDYEFYIRCRDKNGNTNEDELKISLCVDDGEDKNVPRVVQTYPLNNGFTEFGLNDIEAGIYMNEPSECKWDLKDRAYVAMDSEFNCTEDITNHEVDFTYLCSDVFDLTGETMFYIRCKDQPWLTGSDADRRNVMNSSFVYKLNPSESKLEIVGVSPESDIEVSTNPAMITLQVETAGGAEAGKAVCEHFSGGGWNLFFETGGRFHKQEEFSVNTGRNKISIRCEDAGGNIVESEMNFKVIKDTGSPQIARIYIDGGSIRFITTEDADCAYSTSSCSFNFASGSSAGSGVSHSVPLTADTYYIKCADEHGNAPSGCSVVVRGVSYV